MTCGGAVNTSDPAAAVGAPSPQAASVPVRRGTLSGIKAVGIAVGIVLAAWLIGVVIAMAVSPSLASVPPILMVIGTSLWAAFDSSSIRLRDYKTRLASHPVVLMFSLWLLWIVVFPAYLVVRSRILAGQLERRERPIRLGLAVGGIIFAVFGFVALGSAALFIGAGGSVEGIWTTTNSQLVAANTAPQKVAAAAPAPATTPQPATVPAIVPTEPAPSGKPLEVKFYVAPEIEGALRSTGLDEDRVKAAIHEGLNQRRIYCTPENAVSDDSDDWLSVRFSKADARVTEVVVEMAVVNGVSANFQRIRWSGRKMVLLRSTVADVERVLDSMLSELRTEYGTPAYREGRMRSE